MKKLSLLILLLAGVSTQTFGENTRATNPNALSVEVLGRGLVWGAYFDRAVNDDFAGGIGFGTSAVTGAAESATMIPFYFNYYFVQDQGSLFATAGATIVVNNNRVAGGTSTLGNFQFASSSGVIPTLGLGYENRGDTSGFLIRVTAYGLIGQKFTPWVGFALGYAF